MTPIRRPAPASLRRAACLSLAMLLALLASGCSDDEDAPRLSLTPTTTQPSAVPDVTLTLAPDVPPCGLLTEAVPDSETYCNAVPDIADGSVTVSAGAEFCTRAATAPPSFVNLEFWGRTDQVSELAALFAELAPLAPDDLVEKTEILADLSSQYLELLQRRDAGELGVDEAEAEFNELRRPIDEANPDLLDTWVGEVVQACLPPT